MIVTLNTDVIYRNIQRSDVRAAGVNYIISCVTNALVSDSFVLINTMSYVLSDINVIYIVY